jgi:hypothetical protein
VECVSRAFGWGLSNPERLDGVKQKAVVSALCCALLAVDTVSHPVCRMASMDGNTFVREPFYPGQDSDCRVVDGLGRPEVFPDGRLCSMVVNRG